jgi:hypothetical protein
MPPKVTPGACSTDQIAKKYALCERSSPQYSAMACRAFDLDAANTRCLGCLFSASDGATSGAIIVVDDHWLANLGGCEALVDGDSSPDGCGARVQADSICEYEACINACASDATQADFDACRSAAKIACGQYRSKISCSGLPQYTACHQMSFADYFTTMGDLFCGSGLPAVGQGGAGGESAGGAGGAP